MPKTIKPKNFTRQQIKKKVTYRSRYKVVDGMLVPSDPRAVEVASVYRQALRGGYLPSGKISKNTTTATMAQEVLNSLGISVKIDNNPNLSLTEEENINLKNKNIVVELKGKSTEMNFQEMFDIAPSPTDPLYVMDDSVPNYLKKQNLENSKINVIDLVAAISHTNKITKNNSMILKQLRR